MLETINAVLRDRLQLGSTANNLAADSALLGHLSEFDSMAVVTVLAAVEEEYGIVIEDDDVSADTFETVRMLIDFVKCKVNS